VVCSGALGSGLAIFTKFPIISAQALPYSLSGLPLAVIAGDFFVNKAAGSVVVLHPELGEVEIWNTHVCPLLLRIAVIRLTMGLDACGGGTWTADAAGTSDGTGVAVGECYPSSSGTRSIRDCRTYKSGSLHYRR
jgi:hypothetical protein